ncbi:hypothetical protein [Candidatus Electronema sp. JM]|uniref:hypothetical protein n=1 Tax=Candidatus Electronema sp. JM TaxID=3401571 RepID=UPI003AA8F36B
MQAVTDDYRCGRTMTRREALIEAKKALDEGMRKEDVHEMIQEFMVADRYLMMVINSLKQPEPEV